MSTEWVQRILWIGTGLILGVALSFQVFSQSRVYVTFKETEVRDGCETDVDKER